MPFTLIRQDITKMAVDAIVNAANENLYMGGGVCGAIFNAAGPEKLQSACRRAAPVATGSAAITPGFALPAKYVIHAVGPVYNRFNSEKCAGLLRSAYASSLELALENHCESIAFPLISSGIYGYPKDEALQIATGAIRDFLDTNDMDIYLAVFDKSSFDAGRRLIGSVESYIDQTYVDKNFFSHTCGVSKMSMLLPLEPLAMLSAFEKPFDDIISDLDEPFSDTLFRLIDKKGKKDSEVYKRANIDRKLFSKIRSVKGYTPKKNTILALSVALELDLEETDDLLRRAGYALSHANKFDVIVEYFIINKQYDIYEINKVLFHYDQPLLGA